MREFLDELRRRNVLRVALAYLATAWLLVQVLETVLPVFGVADIFLRSTIIILSILFVPVLALSWIFEWSAGEISRQSEVGERAGTRAGTRTFDRIVIGTLTVAVAFFAADKFLWPALDRSGAGGQSIAVLPFADLTADQDKAYFGDGLAEDLLDRLASNPALQVAARTSSFSFRDAGLPVSEIAARLGVAYVLEGSIRNLDERAQITVRLVSAEDGYNVWSNSFDRDLAQITSIKNDVLTSVQEALGITGSATADTLAPPEPEAYVISLEASYKAREGSQASIARAIELFQRALEIDPDYALAWSNLASTYINSTVNGAMEWNEGYRKARDAALRSVAIDSGHAPGYKALAFVARYFEGDMGLAVENMQRALDESPASTSILSDAATLLLNLQRVEDAIRIEEHLVERSPLDVVAVWNLALAYRYAGRFDESAAAFRQALALSPAVSTFHYHLGETLLLAGSYAEALKHFREEPDEAYRIKGQALALFALGETQAADRALRELEQQYGDQWPSEVAHVHAFRGEADAAFEWLDRELLKYGPGGWGEWQLQRLYDNLRDDPRWQSFLRRTGTAPEQLAGLALQLPAELL